MVDAEPIHQSAIDGRAKQGTFPTDIIALIVVPDRSDTSSEIFISRRVIG